MSSDDDSVVVIGSGPCGAAAARKLVERGLSVVMLDAGLRAPAGLLARVGGRTVVRRKGWAEYAEHRHAVTSDDVVWVSSLSLGGLSNYWTTAIPRYAPDDFTDGGRLDERYVWPVTYDELVPYYEMLEPEMGLAAGDPILGIPHGAVRHRVELPGDWRSVAARAQGRGHGVGALPMARGRPSMLVRRGTEFDSYHCMVAPLESSASFRLVTGAYVLRLNWSSTAQRVESVDYVDRRTGERKSIRGRAFVVAAGAIDSTVILLRSRSADFPTGLGDSSGVLGRYLHDHPREWWTFLTDTPLTAVLHPVYVARPAYADTDPLMGTSLTIGLTPSVGARLRSFCGGSTTVFGVQVFGTMVPTPEAGVEVGDWDGSRPRIRLSYDAAARRNLASARDRVTEVLGSAGVATRLPGPFHDLVPGTSIHYAGSVRMHADPKFGVLNGWNRMHDAPEVAVVDASCFTTGPEKNPTLTSMALASRAADRLADDLLAGGV